MRCALCALRSYRIVCDRKCRRSQTTTESSHTMTHTIEWMKPRERQTALMRYTSEEHGKPFSGRRFGTQRKRIACKHDELYNDFRVVVVVVVGRQRYHVIFGWQQCNYYCTNVGIKSSLVQRRATPTKPPSPPCRRSLSYRDDVAAIDVVTHVVWLSGCLLSSYKLLRACLHARPPHAGLLACVTWRLKVLKIRNKTHSVPSSKNAS